MMTEDEAKTKWCPYARASFYVNAMPAAPSEHGYAGNRDTAGLVVPNVNCIGSACMAWEPEIKPFNLTEGRFLHDGESYSSIDKFDYRPSGCGDCGLKRRPE